jgi:hypothetical protein
MMNEPIKITDLDSLKREKQRLNVYCHMQEERIKDKINSVRTNYKQIIGEELLPFSTEINSKVSQAMDWVNDFIINKFIKPKTEGQEKITGGIIKLAEVLLVRLVSSVFKK